MFARVRLIDNKPLTTTGYFFEGVPRERTQIGYRLNRDTKGVDYVWIMPLFYPEKGSP
jgi:hypothetical protein